MFLPAAALLVPCLLADPITQEEPVGLPRLAAATVDEQPAGRPELTITSAGKILAGETVLFDPYLHPAYPDPTAELRAWLLKAAEGMDKAQPPGAPEGTPALPDGPLLIRADRSAPLRDLRRVLEVCAEERVAIWRIQLACVTAKGEPGQLTLPLPIGERDAAQVDLEVLMRIQKDRATGVKLSGLRLRPGDPPVPYTDEDGEARPHRRFLWNTAGLAKQHPSLRKYPMRVMEYIVGPFKTKDLAAFQDKLARIHKELRPALPIDPTTGALGVPMVTIDARAGTCTEDLALLLDALIAAGFERFQFAAPL